MEDVLKLLATNELVDLLFSGVAGEKSYDVLEILNERMNVEVKNAEVRKCQD